MSTFAIVGAGDGLGLAAAQRFGREGFSVALLSRSQDSVDQLAERLGEDGVEARGFAADVRDVDAVRGSLADVAEQLGPVTALQYSPLPAKRYLQPVLETSAEDLQDALSFSVLGLAAAAHAVLPGMREAGGGSILLVNGGSAVNSKPKFSGTSVAFPAESALGEMLHAELAHEGIRVRQLIIPGAIEADHPDKNPASLADQLYQLHDQPGDYRVFATSMDEDD